ncbi:hypothetical protein [Acinetobacter bereziniae]|uniref:hypothetical protein n=1 Tax=Acinetobacter bereziniae TaxID=106648 RepID=UPI00125EAC2F|nr:hypothetical protein [Acinetobacter bereziniae]
MLISNVLFIALLGVLSVVLLNFIINGKFEELIVGYTQNENPEKIKHYKLAAIWFVLTLYSIISFLIVFFTTFNYLWMFIFGFSAFICGAQAAQRERQASVL